MIRLFSVLFIFLSYSKLFSQDLPAFNKVYMKTFVETAQKDMKLALQVADSLYTISETPLLQARSLMLSASLYKQTAEVKKSVGYALKAEEILENTDNYGWQAKIDGFLASAYRHLKLYTQSRTYLEKAILASKKIEDPKSALNVKGLMQQEKAYLEIEQKKYREAILSIDRSQKAFDLIEGSPVFFTINNEQLLGLSFYHLKEFDKALTHYHKALKVSKGEPENFITGLVYNGLTLVYVEQKDNANAEKYFKLAKKIADDSEFLELKKEILETSKKYYVFTKNVDKIELVQKSQDSVTEKIATKSQEFVNDSFATLKSTNTVVEKRNSNKNIIIILCLLLLFGGLAYFIYARRKHQIDLENFRSILKQSEEKTTVEDEVDHASSAVVQNGVGEEKISEDLSAVMNAETERKLIAKLEEFENSKMFTENTISLATLATFCERNTKYLSYVINTYKKKDFNNYINELRVKYIIKKLKNEDLCRKYKISVLAEEGGFSSPNKFSTVFKNVTSITPSTFIKYLEEEEA